jgi:hypothetical protein
VSDPPRDHTDEGRAHIPVRLKISAVSTPIEIVQVGSTLDRTISL